MLGGSVQNSLTLNSVGRRKFMSRMLEWMYFFWKCRLCVEIFDGFNSSVELSEMKLMGNIMNFKIASRYSNYYYCWF